MTSFRFKPAAVLAALALAGLTATTSSLASQASGTRAPTVTTGRARLSSATATSVTLTGTINGHEQSFEYYFQYGATDLYGSQTPTVKVTEDTHVEKISASASHVLAGYHYRLVAINSAGEKREGRDRTILPAKVKRTKQKKLAFDLPHSFQPTVVGAAFVFDGSLTGTGNGAREVVLQESPYPYSAGFTDVGAPVLTSATGAFSFRLPSLRSSTRFRAVMLGPPELISDTLTQLVEVRVTLKVHASKLVKGLVRLYGTVSPTATGAHVFFQLEQAPKPHSLKAEKPQKESKVQARQEKEKPPTFVTKFGTVVKRATRSFSHFSLVVKVKSAGNYRAFVQMPVGPLASGESQTVALKTAKKKRKHSGLHAGEEEK
ncbi:MAG TPA: hypothetical protein VMF09_11115 [Solirubrobacteraceae bacterium]|nr:hypothetical protein [Solirubrobacteraceae bacterium]